MESNLMIQILLVSVGGAIGAVLRYFIVKITPKLVRQTDVYTGILFSNLIGCFLAGFILALLGENPNISQETILFLTVGILGSITTFSTFALESYQLLGRGNYIETVTYLFLHVVIAFLVTAGGYALYQLTGGG